MHPTDALRRTLRRAHTAHDRQSRLKLIRARESARRTGTGDNSGNIDDGYGEALHQWRINEAVERAGGRAKAFLRQLWWVCLLAWFPASVPLGL